MAKIDGAKQALELLRGLSTHEQKKIIETMRIKDPLMADLLESHLISIEDLQYITVKMFQNLLRSIKLSDLALALKQSSDDLKNFVLKNVSSRMAQDINDVLNGEKRKLSDVQEAQRKIIEVMQLKIEKGEIVIDRNSSDEYV